MLRAEVQEVHEIAEKVAKGLIREELKQIRQELAKLSREVSAAVAVKAEAKLEPEKPVAVSVKKHK